MTLAELIRYAAKKDCDFENTTLHIKGDDTVFRECHEVVINPDSQPISGMWICLEKGDTF